MAAIVEAHAGGRLVALRTSGTTGRPRLVVRTAQSWFRSFEQVAQLTGLEAGSTLWLPGPLSSTMNLFAATMARHLGVDRVDEPRRATHAHLTPMELVRALEAGAPLDGVRLTLAGDRLPGSLRTRAERAGADVTHYYGAAELSFVAWGTDEEDLRPFPGAEVTVRQGEIWVRSPYLCERYDGAPGPLRHDGDGFATVGDHGVFTDGFLRVSGRGGQAVNTGGATVLVSDVEQGLRAAVKGTVIVIGVPHPTLGQVVAAVLTDPDDLRAAHESARLRLDAAQRPRLWFHVPALPPTAAGKIDRQAVLAQVTGPDAVPLVPDRAGTASA